MKPNIYTGMPEEAIEVAAKVLDQIQPRQALSGPSTEEQKRLAAAA